MTMADTRHGMETGAEGRERLPSARFWDRIAEKYARKPVADEAVYQRKLELTRELLTPETEVLEVGCGTGSTAMAHAPHAGRVMAYDFSSKMIEIARSKARDAGVENVEFACASIEGLDVPDESFDVAMAHSVLHLVEDRAAALRRIRELLRPGGAFVSSTVCLGDRMGWFRYIAPLGRRLGLLPVVKVFGERDLLAGIEAAGFDIENVWRPDGSLGVFVIARRPA